MLSADTHHSAKFKILKAISASRRFFRAHSVVLSGQVLLILLQLSLLAMTIDWIVGSLLHLPLVVTLVAVLLITLPAFYLSWVMLRFMGEQDNSH